MDDAGDLTPNPSLESPDFESTSYTPGVHNAAFFAHFDALSCEVSKLESAPALYQQALRRKTQVASTLTSHEKLLAQVKDKQQHYEFKIRKDEQGPSFAQPKTWFPQSRTSRIGRSKAKLEAAKQAEIEETRIIEHNGAEYQRILRSERSHGSEAAKLEAAKSELGEMRADVINQNTTGRLSRVRRERAQQQTQHDLDASALVRLREVVAMVQSAKHDFDEAFQWEMRAQRDNQRAQFDARWDGGDRWEQMDQYRRDQDMNAALMPARRGTQKLQQAFSMLPPVIYQRYGALAGGIGKVPIPNLERQDFGEDLMYDYMGGGFGALVNDWQAGGKIQRNMRVIEQCMQVTSSQRGQLMALISQFEADLAHQRQTLSRLEVQEQTEETTIFDRARRTAISNH